MRIDGLAGQVLQKLGLVPQQIPAGDVYPALERGTIDAAEWVGPYDDEKLGFNRVAPYYYYPGFWEGGPMLMFFFNKPKWDELPKNYKAIVQAAAGTANVEMQAKCDAGNPGALRRLVGGGAQLRSFPQEVMEASYKSANELYDELSTKRAVLEAHMLQKTAPKFDKGKLDRLRKICEETDLIKDYGSRWVLKN
jgi:TRAP-type mannitol/chloroaromatic compound transport system substrate-binding protein